MEKKWKLIIAFIACTSLSGCYVAESAYYPDYDEDYIYSVGYYGYQPYDWGDGYYNTYGWGTRDWNNAYYASPFRYGSAGSRMYHGRGHGGRR